MFALDLYETARDMWMSIRSQDVMELPEENADLSEPVSYTHLETGVCNSGAAPLRGSFL